MDAAAYVYPWDVIGDPAAAETVAALGVSHAVVAAFYHATRAFTARHPRHRVVVAEHTASYLPVGEAWDGVLPAPQTWIPDEDAFGTAASALAAAGVPTHAWVVVAHVDSFDGTHVVNAYGDVYPWALCPSQESVVEYAVGLAAVAAARPDVSGIEFEAAGWYGFDHLHQHDKVAGIPLAGVDQYLMSLCFCAACDAEYRSSGIDPAVLRTEVREQLDLTFAGRPRHRGLEDAHALLGMRVRVADRLREAIVREVRSQRDADFPVLFHGNPHPHRSTAFTGIDMATLAKGASGVVVNCWDGNTENVSLSVGNGANVYAGLLGVQGMGMRPQAADQFVDGVLGAGAAGIRIYHAGLASDADLVTMKGMVDRCLAGS